MIKFIGATLAMFTGVTVSSAKGHDDPLAPTGCWTDYTAGRAWQARDWPLNVAQLAHVHIESI